VQLGEIDVEGADHTQHRLGDERCSIRVEQPIEHAPDPIVIQRLCVAGREPEQARLVDAGPLADPIERSVRDDDVGHQHRDDHRRVETEPCVVVHQVGIERLPQTHPLEEVLDDRQSTDPCALQFEAFRSSHHPPP
jgi:hypothetical protein